MAPVAKKRWQTNSCSNGGTGLLRCVLVAMSGMFCKIYKIVAGLKRYFLNTSSSCKSSSGLDRSRNKRGRLTFLLTRLMPPRNCRMCAAIFVFLSTALSTLLNILGIFKFHAQV